MASFAHQCNLSTFNAYDVFKLVTTRQRKGLILERDLLA